MIDFITHPSSSSLLSSWVSNIERAAVSKAERDDISFTEIAFCIRVYGFSNKGVAALCGNPAGVRLIFDCLFITYYIFESYRPEPAANSVYKPIDEIFYFGIEVIYCFTESGGEHHYEGHNESLEDDDAKEWCHWIGLRGNSNGKLNISHMVSQQSRQTWYFSTLVELGVASGENTNAPGVWSCF